MYRVFTGWRVTDDTNPLIPNNIPALKDMLKQQSVMKLKSGQTPPMYAKLHWTNWVDKIVDFTDKNINDRCIESRRMESGAKKGNTYHTVHREMESLLYYGFPMYPKYKQNEENMHIPRRQWKVLLPGRKRLFQTIRL